MQNTQRELLNVNFRYDLNLPEPEKFECEDGLNFEHFPVGLHFLDYHGCTGSVHVNSPHQTQA